MYGDRRALDGRSSAYETRTGQTVPVRKRLAQNTGIINAYAHCLLKLGFYRLLNTCPAHSLSGIVGRCTMSTGKS